MTIRSTSSVVPSVKCTVLPSQRTISRFGVIFPSLTCARTPALLFTNDRRYDALARQASWPCPLKPQADSGYRQIEGAAWGDAGPQGRSREETEPPTFSAAL